MTVILDEVVKPPGQDPARIPQIDLQAIVVCSAVACASSGLYT